MTAITTIVSPLLLLSWLTASAEIFVQQVVDKPLFDIDYGNAGHGWRVCGVAVVWSVTDWSGLSCELR